MSKKKKKEKNNQNKHLQSANTCGNTISDQTEFVVNCMTFTQLHDNSLSRIAEGHDHLVRCSLTVIIVYKMIQLQISD